ncbi:MAG: hypothetical protein HY881_12360 [Deltaproteobacteria bacterium]|nr:hypothetical protein [Deltaproteobacteria bacterium]
MINQAKKIFKVFAVIATMISLFYLHLALALEVKTHKAINEHISTNTLNGFSLDDHLKNQLGMQDGKDTYFNNKKVFNSLGDGGVTEDKPDGCVPYWRSRNHFHNPINNSGFSGWWDTGIFSGMSAIDWIMEPANSQSCGYYSWNDARTYYFNALFVKDKVEKETNFAQTFRALGQCMHLVQDMSVPEHTRNNGHYFAYDYEKWVDEPDNRAAISSYSSITYTANDSFPLSISHLFDTNQYDGTNPDITQQATIGLSEYSNANFLSPDTIFSGFIYPAYSDMTENIVSDGIENILYLKKCRNGETIDFFARAKNFYNYLPPDYKDLALTLNDDFVYMNYAQKLIPRAIGYSSQALSYFFRGKFDVVLVLPLIEEGNIWGFAFYIKNMTQTKDAIAEGKQVGLKYEPTVGSPIRTATTLKTALSYDSETLVYFWINQPINTADLEIFNKADFTIVYQGVLGSEDNAVIGKVFKQNTALYIDEDWYSLEGNYQWIHTMPGDVQNPDNGDTINKALNNVLIKENVRYVDADGSAEKARFNETLLNLKDAGNPNGIPITKNTYIQYKIDDMSIVNKPEASVGHTNDFQGVWLSFNNGLQIQMYYDSGVTTGSPNMAYWTFSLGNMMIDNIYKIFKDSNIVIPEPLYLESIDFWQQLLPSPDSPLEAKQHMEVDYFRIMDCKIQPPDL